MVEIRTTLQVVQVCPLNTLIKLHFIPQIEISILLISYMSLLQRRILSRFINLHQITMFS
jgi:hypothetical protein